MFRVEVALPVRVDGLKLVAAPAGNPLTLRLTCPVNPSCGKAEIPMDPLVPGTIDKDGASRASAKSGLPDEASGPVIVTLSKTAVFRVPMLFDVTARPA